jgi:hypothetical protein
MIRHANQYRRNETGDEKYHAKPLNSDLMLTHPMPTHPTHNSFCSVLGILYNPA